MGDNRIAGYTGPWSPRLNVPTSPELDAPVQNFARAFVFGIRHYAHNFQIARVGGTADAKTSANGIFAREEATHKFFAHHRYATTGRSMAFIEGTAPQNLRANCPEVAGRDSI